MACRRASGVSEAGPPRWDSVRTCVRLGLVLALLGAEAAAQPIATGERSPEPAHPPAGLGGALTVGRAGMAGTEAGWLVRLDYEVFPVLAPRDTPGVLFGFHVGWEVWRASPDWGLALPVAIVFGVRAQPVRATIGVGVDGLLVDVVDDDTGVGFYAPLACARVGADVFGLQLGADARIVRRWQIGAPDHTQWQLGAFLGATWESKDRRPRY
jgi:hypothetical protein